MRRLAPFAIALAALAVLAGTAGASLSNPGRVANNPADRLASEPIDAYRYDHAKRCLRAPRPGTVALAGWLDRHARGESWGITRCARLGDGYSLHSEGRALDWRLDAGRPAERRAAIHLGLNWAGARMRSSFWRR